VETDDTVKVFGSSAIMPELSGYLMKAGIVISELAEKEMSLEEYFISITGGTKE
jgi:ABC-2 type transport system ATP-binding protein